MWFKVVILFEYSYFYKKRKLIRFISPLSPSEALAVQKQMTSRLSPKKRKRFTAILLSSRHYVSITELSIICCVSLSTIKSWFNRYDLGDFSALLDAKIVLLQKVP